MRSFAGERPPPPIASPPSSSDRRLKGHRDLREAASPQRIRLAPPWESYNRTATGFAPLTFSIAKSLVPQEGFEPPTPSLRSAESWRPRGTRLFAAVRGNALSYTDG